MSPCGRLSSSMTQLFFTVFTLLLLAELIKGLSANGTPPVLQKYAWQLDLAYFMWSNIRLFRIILVGILILLFFFVLPQVSVAIIVGVLLFLLAWGFLYWLFNLFWVGKHKFKPLTHPNFVTATDNNIDLSAQVLGIEQNGTQKAYPASMVYYHHQIPDEIADLPIWVTYCGLCRSGRIYDKTVDGQTLTFELVGAITFNAVFKDLQTGSWWRQETGEAVKGTHKGKVLDALPMEQMSLEHWLAKYPDSLILQYDPTFQKIYDFLTKLMKYEVSKPSWHMQEEPPLVIGVELNGNSKAYDWNELKKRRLVMDTVGDTEVLLISSEDESSAFAYKREVKGDSLEFHINGDELTDTKTASKWNLLGQCVEGELQGSELESLQNYQQFVRSWVTFHPDTTFYDYFSAAS